MSFAAVCTACKSLHWASSEPMLNYLSACATAAVACEVIAGCCNTMSVRVSFLEKASSCRCYVAGLPSDHALPDDPECLRFIQAYADDQQLFFKDFAAAYLQLTSLGAVWA
jgi:hypothetical protein